MPNIIVNSVSPTYEQSNHKDINGFEQVLRSLISINLSSTWSFSKITGSLQQKPYNSWKNSWNCPNFCAAAFFKPKKRITTLDAGLPVFDDLSKIYEYVHKTLNIDQKPDIINLTHLHAHVLHAQTKNIEICWVKSWNNSKKLEVYQTLLNLVKTEPDSDQKNNIK